MRDKYYNQRTKRDGSLAWEIPTFNDLHPNYGIPWFFLVCCQFASNNDIVDMFDPFYSFLIRFFPTQVDAKSLIKKETAKTDTNRWIPMDFEDSLGDRKKMRRRYDRLIERTSFDLSKDFSQSNYTADSFQKYNPKYKIVLHMDKD